MPDPARTEVAGERSGELRASVAEPTVVFGAGRRPEAATHVRLESFDGPLALLLALIEARQLDVLTVPLGAVAGAYLDALALLDADRLGNISSFVAIAGQLILIKSRAMLPRHAEGPSGPLTDEGPDPEAELRARLILYRAYRDAGAALQEVATARVGLFRREPGAALAAALAGARPGVVVPFDPALLAGALDRVVRLVPAVELPPEVLPRTVTIGERAAIIRAALRSAPSVVLQDLLEDVRDRVVVVVTFLAMLELVKRRAGRAVGADRGPKRRCLRPGPGGQGGRRAVRREPGVVRVSEGPEHMGPGGAEARDVFEVGEPVMTGLAIEPALPERVAIEPERAEPDASEAAEPERAEPERAEPDAAEADASEAAAGSLSEAEVEALLFVAERPLTRREIGALAGVDRETVDARLGDLEVSLRGRGIRLATDGERVELVTAPGAGPLIARYIGADSVRLSAAALETLAIVAYRQPVTKAVVERIRGVDSDYTIRSLLHRRLVVELGRTDGPGRPYLYGTGFDFLERFGLTSLEELPPLDADVAARLVEADDAPTDAAPTGDAERTDAAPTEVVPTDDLPMA
jgi:segregation and condensation protein B